MPSSSRARAAHGGGHWIGARPSFFDTKRNVLILRHMQVLHIRLISTLFVRKGSAKA
jgi:hypothetical protein